MIKSFKHCMMKLKRCHHDRSSWCGQMHLLYQAPRRYVPQSNLAGLAEDWLEDVLNDIHHKTPKPCLKRGLGYLQECYVWTITAKENLNVPKVIAVDTTFLQLVCDFVIAFRKNGARSSDRRLGSLSNACLICPKNTDLIIHPPLHIKAMEP